MGDPEQVAAKLARYVALGIDTLMLSAYPHRREAERVCRQVLPRLRALVAPGTDGSGG